VEKKRILIIEDEKDIVLFLKEALEDEEYEVIAVGNGLDAQEIMKNRSFELVILDMLLPGEHGMNIVDYIRDNFFTPIIITSGIYKRDEILSTFEDSNVKDFFQKPFKIKELLKKIDSILNEKKL